MIPTSPASLAPAPLLAAPASAHPDGWALTSEEGVRILYAAGKPVKVEVTVTAPFSNDVVQTIVEAAIGAEIVPWGSGDWTEKVHGGERAPINLMEDAAAEFGWKPTHALTLTAPADGPALAWTSFTWRVMLTEDGGARTASEAFYEEPPTWSYDGAWWARGTSLDFPGVFKVESLAPVVP